MSNDFSRLDAVGQAELVRRGDVSPLELVEASIAGIEQTNGSLNAVIHPLFEQAREHARGALPEGPFRGVPFLFKDMDAPLAGAPFHVGMKLLKQHGYVAPRNSYFADKVLAAGFIALGKTNTPELGLAVTTEPEAYGPSRNPWNLDHSTGGSSGGSAAAVAARIVPAAHAGDGGGSIRIPASECGLVGLKPSRGRVSLGPQYAEYWSGLVANHVVTWSVRDSARILDCLAGSMPGDPYAAPLPDRPYAQEVGAPLEQLRIGILDRMPGESGGLHPQCSEAVRATGLLLESLGHRVEAAYPAALGRREELIEGFMGIISAWVAASLDEWGKELGVAIRESDVEPGTWMFAEMGRAQAASGLVGHLKWAGGYTREMAQWWQGGFDLLLTPTLTIPPPRLGWLQGDSDDPTGGLERVISMLAFGPPFNLTGQPAISLPLHWTPDGLPVGLQFVAAMGREDVLVRLAAQLEEAHPWAERLPPVCAVSP